jgi:hypothetical protein
MANDEGEPAVIPVAPDAPASGKDFDDRLPKPSGDGPSEVIEIPED